uniref:Uncharacterized protein n=1 Tax=Octopus bimaculoides TaxID=37653 RepID=A0A0L8I8A4_OCTBM
MEYAELMLVWPELFENILWSDEAVFHVGDFINRLNFPFCASCDKDPNMTVERMQVPPKVTMWCEMTATRVVGPYLLRDTMDTDCYLQVLKHYVWTTVSRITLATRYPCSMLQRPILH